MRSIFLILALCGNLYSQQSPAAWWAESSQEQRDFAEKCYKFGKQYGRGHTLAVIAWIESSLGKDIKHDHKESSFGVFGISRQNFERYRARAAEEPLRDEEKANRQRVVRSIQGAKEGFDEQAWVALQIFEDNIKHFRRLGYSPREAYFWAYPRYNAGNKWHKFKRRGVIFSQRVAFLKTKFK